MKNSLRRVAFILSFACTMLAPCAQATPGQPGTLDASWATSSPLGAGTVITPIGSSNDSATAMMLQPDGKVLVAGQCSNGTNSDFCVARYDGGSFGYQNCKPDIDGDGLFLATTDVLIYARIALGISGPDVVNASRSRRPPPATPGR